MPCDGLDVALELSGNLAGLDYLSYAETLLQLVQSICDFGYVTDVRVCKNRLRRCACKLYVLHETIEYHPQIRDILLITRVHKFNDPVEAIYTIVQLLPHFFVRRVILLPARQYSHLCGSDVVVHTS